MRRAEGNRQGRRGPPEVPAEASAAAGSMLFARPMPTAAAPPMPLTIGGPEQFRKLRTSLQQLDFTEEGVCRRAGIPSIFEFKTLRAGRQTAL